MALYLSPAWYRDCSRAGICLGQALCRSGHDFGLPCFKACGSVSFLLQEDVF